MPRTAALRLASVCLAALSAAAPALADDAAATGAADAADVIVVTASRTAESRDLAPAPVAVIDAADIDRIGAQHVSEVLNRAPGVFINRGNGAEHLTAIRSPVLTGGAGAGSFLYLEDGVPLRAAGFANVNGLFEAVDGLAGQVEVLRGPGPAQYGSNALHGLVNVISRDPEEAGRLAELEAGSFGRVRARAFAGGETRFGAGFVGATWRHEDGWRDDAGLDRFALQTRLDGAAGRTDWSLRAALIDLDQETATYVRGADAYKDEALSRRNADPEAFRNGEAARVALHLDTDLGNGRRLETVAYGRSNRLDFRLHFLPSEALERSGHDSLGLQSQLAVEGSRGVLRFGIDAEITDGFLIEDQTRPSFGDFPQGLHYDYEVESLVGAAFVQGRWRASERLSIEAGARAEAVRYDYATNIAPGVSGRFLVPADREDDFSTFAPSLGFTFEAAEPLQIFGRVARGVRAPQTAELYRLQPGQEIDGIEPETLDSVEAGARIALPAGGRLELVAFAMEKENVFFRDADGFNVTDGVTTHDGVEFDLTLPLGERVTLSAAGTWAIHEYGFDRTVSRGSEVIRDGARVDTAPEWLWNAALVWRPLDPAEIEAEWVHVGEYFTDAANSARYEGHDLLNLRARWSLSPRASVFGAVRNVFDERYAERADFAFGSDRYFPGEPRAVSIGVRVTG